jgi:UDP-N-acetylglucosamine--N-acetylmuramyl-(pentapeptide) pyrophosphoryl-undecaprenol N-acetylglucosamine transferase
MQKKVILVAGGTGGHINAALAIGSEFEKNNFETIYISGQRYLDYQILKNSKSKVYNLNAMALRFKHPIKVIKSLFINTVLFFKGLKLISSHDPNIVIGTGGYICGPILLAAKVLGRKTAIVEQNAVMGITNRLLQNIVDKIFINFEQTKYLKKNKNIVVSGNPIRSEILRTKIEVGNFFNILVFGGSLGAGQINKAIKTLIESGSLAGVAVFHQVGKDNVDTSIKMKSTIKYHQVEYIDDMQSAYSKSNLIICRSGASTISELEVVSRPVVFIPFAAASDNHQFYNAQEYCKKTKNFAKIIDPSLDNKDLCHQLLSCIKAAQASEQKDENTEGSLTNPRRIIYSEAVRL